MGWTDFTRRQYGRQTGRYASDLTDREWSRRWCSNVGESGFRSLISRLCGFCLATDGFRACAVKDAVEDLAADGDFRLLGTA